jgi:hypothetical protein
MVTKKTSLFMCRLKLKTESLNIFIKFSLLETSELEKPALLKDSFTTFSLFITSPRLELISP